MRIRGQTLAHGGLRSGRHAGERVRDSDVKCKNERSNVMFTKTYPYPEGRIGQYRVLTPQVNVQLILSLF